MQLPCPGELPHTELPHTAGFLFVLVDFYFNYKPVAGGWQEGAGAGREGGGYSHCWSLQHELIIYKKQIEKLSLPANQIENRPVK